MPALLSNIQFNNGLIREFDDIGLRATEILNTDPVFRHEKGNNIEICGEPLMLSEKAYRNICLAAESIHGAQESLITHLKQDLPDTYGQHLPFLRQLRVKSKHGKNLFLSRYDFIIDDAGTAKFLEFNSSCPAGMTYLHRWRSVLREVWPNSSLLRSMPMPLDNPTVFTDRLLRECIANYSVADQPNVALVNDNANLTLELENIKNLCALSGGRAQIINLSQINYAGGKLLDNKGEVIDLVYCKIRPTPSVMRGWNEDLMRTYAPFLNAAADDAVCILNPFSAMTLGEDKGLLASMRSEKHKNLFTQDQLSTIEKHIPKTEFFQRDNAEQQRNLAEKKDRYVLKPRMESRGRFVVVGDETSQAEWMSAVAACNDMQWIVQERVYPSREFRSHSKYSSQTVAVYIIGGEAMGMMSRVSTSAINNVAGSGKIQAVFVAE